MRTWDEIVRSLENGPSPDELPSESKIILFETLWSDPADGWAIASRANARAMQLAGIDVRLHSWAPVSPHWQEVRQEVQGMLKTCPRDGWGFYVFSTTLAGADRMGHPLGMVKAFRAPRAFYTTFERTSIEPELAAMLKPLDGIWVPCKANQRVLKEAGVDAACIPFPFFPGDLHLKTEPQTREPRVFYWIGKWEPRKAPDNLVRAFFRAFAPGESELRMKFSPVASELSEWVSFEQVVEEELQREDNRRRGWHSGNWRDSIKVIDVRLSPRQMVGLHADGDVYVTASRGEGTDLPALQAKLSSRRLIATESGGPADFIGERDILVPATGTIPVHPSYRWGKNAEWIDYDLNDLIAALQTARAGKPEHGSAPWPKHRFTAATVANQFKEWIEQCAKRAGKEW